MSWLMNYAKSGVGAVTGAVSSGVGAVSGAVSGAAGKVAGLVYSSPAQAAAVANSAAGRANAAAIAAKSAAAAGNVPAAVANVNRAATAAMEAANAATAVTVATAADTKSGFRTGVPVPIPQIASRAADTKPRSKWTISSQGFRTGVPVNAVSGVAGNAREELSTVAKHAEATLHRGYNEQLAQAHRKGLESGSRSEDFLRPGEGSERTSVGTGMRTYKVSASGGRRTARLRRMTRSSSTQGAEEGRRTARKTSRKRRNNSRRSRK